jgi:recombination protein RecT
VPDLCEETSKGAEEVNDKQVTTGASVSLISKALQEEDFRLKISQSLPKGVGIDRFIRVTLTAIQNAPKQIEGADRLSLYNAIIRAASDGLVPDGREGALVAFNTKDGKMIQWMPMITGLIKRIAECGVTVESQIICQNDLFDVAFGDDAKIIHKPAKLGLQRGSLIGAYAIARLPGGAIMREVMDREQLESVRAVSRSAESGPWASFFDEMCRKTVLRRLIKRVPITDARVQEVIARDDELYELPAGAPTPAAPAVPTERPATLQAVVDKAAAPVLEDTAYRGEDQEEHDVA